ncbi:MAG: NAD(P)-dependent oxidoreductase [Caulobacteraceae bacterium]|nr:NAD(P)-dependent oxidoreductase [Caulobacteraceae bacterium]
MYVAVTGSSGKIGRAAIKALAAAGHKTVNFDLKPSADGGRFVPVQCADFGEVLGALSGIDTHGGAPDAVLHLAGIPAPGLAPDHVIFENNTQSTYNVFSACARLGIKRIVWASSETILGLPFASPPDFAPLDETHPDRPEWSYSLSKHLGEAMAIQFSRWKPEMAISSLRFSNVYEPHDYAVIVPPLHKQPKLRRGNLWAYVDARDCGEACRLALENGKPGHEAYIIAAADTIMDRPTRELLAEFFPNTPIRGDLGEFQSLLSSQKAGGLLGYAPKHGWRENLA